MRSPFAFPDRHRFLPSTFLAAISFLILLTYAPSPAFSFNITRILAKHPELSTFNHYLTATRLANEINRRRTITVLAVDNAGMASLLSKHYTLLTIRHILSLHVLSDYYGSKKLHQLPHSNARAASVFQSSGDAPGTSGYINITNHRRGKVSFAAEDATDTDTTAVFVKPIKEQPYDISVLLISDVLSSPEADAPAAAPPPVNLTDLLVSKGCKSFAEMLVARSDILHTFEDNLNVGLTVFCPDDAAVKAFAPKFKNLTRRAKTTLLLYHGVPTYYSIQLLKSNNGAVETLATTGTSRIYNYTVQNDGEVVTLETKVDTATIKSTLLDTDPDAVYRVDKVLEPVELFKIVDAPAPAPEGVIRKKGKKGDEPAGPDESPADDDSADDSSAVAVAGKWFVVVLGAVVAMMMA